MTGGTNVTKVNINAPSGIVGIPTTASGPQGPTGQVSNSNISSFLVGNGGNGAAAHFIFANLNGTISAWDTGASSIVQATTPGAVYTGLAINTAQTMIYAADGAGSGGINVFNSSFAPTTVSGTFTDPNLPTGYVPFNIQDIGGKVYVTYAPAGRSAQTGATAGMGFVDVFDENGNFVERLISGGQLAAPWGIALAPASFAPFGEDLLVGNFSYVDSVINAFNPITGAFLGSIPVNIGANWPGEACGTSHSAMAVTAAVPTRSISPMASTAKPTGCSVLDGSGTVHHGAFGHCRSLVVRPAYQVSGTHLSHGGASR